MGTYNFGRQHWAAFALPFAALFGSQAVHAEDYASVESAIIEWADETPSATGVATAEPAAVHPAIARFGPFNVVSPILAELNGATQSETPAQFRAMLRAYPGITQIDMIDCPGTDDDEANFAIAHMIRQKGIVTNVPSGGSVRSGAVELFLAGAKRHAAPTAEFAVHSWRDEDGREADDYAANDPANQEYINFYREIGMDADHATAFYALTNSVANDEALYLKPRDIAAYIPID